MSFRGRPTISRRSFLFDEMAEIVFRFPVVVRQNSIAALPVDSVTECATGYRMLTALVVLLRSIGLMRRRHRAVALENLARRQQLAALTRTVTRAQLRTSDRLFWVLLAKGWRERKWHGRCLVRIVTVIDAYVEARLLRSSAFVRLSRSSADF